jgi:hypothetical protein
MSRYDKSDFHCCNLSCERSAEFVVIDETECDPYLRETHACPTCVGELIGHATDGVQSSDTEHWSLWRIEDVYDVEDSK